VKIIIAGNGKMGANLTRKLSSEGHDLTLIDKSLKILEENQERYDVMVVQGNCASMNVLLQAGVMEADLLIAMAEEDEINLLCCMTAHGLNEKIHTIARIRNPEYEEQIYSMGDMFGLSLSVNPEKQAAKEIERLLKYPGFLKRDTFAKGRVEIVELRIDEKSKLCNVKLNDMGSIVKCKILVCTVLRDGDAIAPDGNFVLKEGDCIFVTAPTNELAELLRNLGIVTHKVKRVILCGGGRVSFYLAKLLEKSNIAVQMIEKDEKRCIKLSDMLPSTCIIHGDASDEFLLESEGISKSDAVVTLTGLDELNMVVSAFSFSKGVPQVITKVGRYGGSSILNELDLGSIISPKELCCNTIVRYVRAMGKQTGAALAVHSIAEGHAEAIEFRVEADTKNCGVPLKKIKLKKNVLLVCISRGNRTEIPNGDSFFNKGDRVIVVTNGDRVISQLNEVFE